MKQALTLTLVFGLVSMAVSVQAEDLKSGLQPGAFIGAFYVTKCAGAEEDGVAVGKNLCYRCMNGGRPQVMVFTRSQDKKVTELVAGLDKAINDNSDKNLRAFVNFLGEDKDALSSEVKKFAKGSSAKSVPFVVPNEFENGPENYGINPDAAVTVIFAKGGEVKANHAVASSKDLDVPAVLAAVQKELK